jgi:hypothetical protein
MKSSGAPNINLNISPKTEKISPITAAMIKKGRATVNKIIEPKIATAMMIKNIKSKNSPIKNQLLPHLIDAININC